MATELEKFVKEKVKILKPDECAIIYDDKRGLLIGACNDKGKIKITSKKVEDFK